MRSILTLRQSGGVLFSFMGYTSFKVHASEQERQEVRGRHRVKPQLGEWRRWKEESQSLAPFLKGLGVPSFATIFVDAILIKNDLSIQLKEDNILEVTDKTLLGSNVTKVQLGAEEVERASRTGRKKFMLSAFENEVDGRECLTVQCRLFQRGLGWYTQQSWTVDKDDILRERMVLKSPDDCDIIVNRAYKRLVIPNLLNDDNGISNTANQPHSYNSDDSGWRKTVFSVAGIGVVCLLTWFLTSGKDFSTPRDKK